MTTSINNQIIHAVAEAKGIDPLEMDIVLGEHVDLEAIEQMARRDDHTWQLTFKLPEYEVTVTSDDQGEITERQASPHAN